MICVPLFSIFVTGYQFRRRIPIGNYKDGKERESTAFGRTNDIRIGGSFDRDSNSHIYRHKNYRQIFIPLQVNMNKYFMLQLILTFRLSFQNKITMFL